MTVALNLHLRASPAQGATSLAVLPGGTVLQATREQGGWYEVEHAGQTGWVSAGFALPLVGEDALAELQAVAAAGGELQLERGVYLLDAPLTLEAETSLVGAGLDQTWIASSAGETVVISRETDARFQALSMLWTGRSAGRVMLAEGGQVTLRQVRLSGAVRDAEARLYGSGLWLSQGARGDLEGSYLTGNGYGLYLSEDSEVSAVGTGLSDNTLAGAIFLDDSGGRIAGSSFDRNGVHGVMVMDRAAPTLSGNQVRDNRQRGITVHGTAAPTLEDNTAEGNGFQGIGVQDDARPTVTGNTLRRNKQSGLAYFGRGGGAASENVMENNRTGVALTEFAAPTLSGNSVRGNVDAGITFADHAAGTVTENVIEANAHPGVSAWGDAQPTLSGNTIRNNKQSGIVLAERVGGWCTATR
ncbi:right-handed parallel beta-helix repeat-containing protein [Deinococcus radiopugnans]|uniref:right-handed parallel beta-helix repeat-containing protein n=1 Tax=Deinococcus radiopugnans TaxID=57497 RepID=UPI003623B534